MTFLFYFQFLLHGLCEWAVVWGISLWVAQGWSQNPAPFPASLVRHPLRSLLMAAFGIAPGLLFLVLNPLLMQMYSQRSMLALWVPISYVLSAIYGVCLGLAACCCAAPSSPQQRFRVGSAATVSAIVIFVSYVLGALLRSQAPLHALVAMGTALVILFIGRSMIVTMSPKQSETPPPISPLSMDPAEAALVRPRRLWPAVIIGFLPTALFLTTLTIAFSKDFNIDQDTGKALLWLCAAVSVVCCFTASILLFKRSTGGAIAGGILFMLLNAFMGFFFGCCASLTGASFR